MEQNHQAEKIQRILEKFKNVPFVHNGRSLEQGVDCLGFVILFYEEFGIHLPSDDGQPIDEDWFKTDPERYIRNIRKLNAKPVHPYDLQPLDMPYFSISRNIITHTGVMINQREFAHMSPNSNLLISKMERHWMRRFRGAVRFDLP